MLEFVSVALGGLLTSYSTHLLGAVRASALTSLLYYLTLGLIIPLEANYYGAMFFGGSFIGMSKASSIEIVLAAIIFIVFYKYVAVLLAGLGGVLGLGALLSIFIVLVFKDIVFKLLALPKH